MEDCPSAPRRFPMTNKESSQSKKDCTATFYKSKSVNETCTLESVYTTLADLIIDSFLESRKVEKVLDLKGAQFKHKGP